MITVALRQQLDCDTRKEYEAAVSVAPELVKTESNFGDFLCVEANIPFNAARRLALYWKARKKVFGDRWLLPMNQTGHGALSKQDIDVLRSGYIVIMPRPSGGIIALMDESRLPAGAEDCKLRILFYFSSIFRKHASLGKAIVHVVTSAPRRTLDLHPEEWQIREKAFPGSGLVKPKIFVAQAYEQGKQELIDFMAYSTLRAEEFKTRLPIEAIAGSSVHNTLALLEERGLERHLLPRSLGGTFDYSQYDDWIRQRLTIEGAMSAAPIQIKWLLSPQGWTNRSSNETISSGRHQGSSRGTASKNGPASADSRMANPAVSTNSTSNDNFLQYRTASRMGPLLQSASLPALVLPTTMQQTLECRGKINTHRAISGQAISLPLTSDVAVPPTLMDGIGVLTGTEPSSSTKRATGVATFSESCVPSHIQLESPPNASRQQWQPQATIKPIVPVCTGPTPERTSGEESPQLAEDTKWAPRKKVQAIRTYQKRNLQVTSLMKQRDQLRRTNEQLRAQNHSLESYLAHARMLEQNISKETPSDTSQW